MLKEGNASSNIPCNLWPMKEKKDQVQNFGFAF